MADKKQLSKQKLEIVNIEIDVSYSQGTKQLDRVQAKNLSLPEGDPLQGKSLRMTIFNKDLKSFVRGKTVIIADVEETERPNTEYGPDRTIVQVYDDQGNPVSRKQGGGGGGGYQRRSLEDDIALENVKRRSIEGQTAMSQVGQLVLAIAQGATVEGVGLDQETFKRLEAKYWQGVEKGLDNYLTQPQPAKRTTGTTSKPDQRPPGQQQAAPKSEAVSKDPPTNPDPVKNVGDLLTRANKVGVNPAKVGEICGVQDVKDLKDLDECWTKVQAKVAESKKDLPF